MEEVIDERSSEEVQELARRIRQLRDGEITGDAAQVLLLEVRGFLIAVGGEPASHGCGAVPSCVHWSTIGADQFLDWVLSGQIKARGGPWPKGGFTGQMSGAFLAGAAEVFGEGNTPPFLKGVLSAWLSKADPGWTHEVDARRIGRDAAKILQERWRLARFVGLPASKLKTSLHLLNVGRLIRMRGWLLGQADRLRRRAQASSEPFELEAAEFLEKGRSQIIFSATYMADPDYPRLVAQELPRMLADLSALVGEMRRSADPVVRRAATILGGKAGSRKKGNINGIMRHAIRSGELGAYIAAVKARWGDGGMLKELYAGIAQLRSQGQGYAADVLAANMRTIACHAFSRGRLDYVSHVMAAFLGEEGFWRLLTRGIAELRNEGEKIAADVLERDARMIVSIALNRGRLDYARTLMAALRGDAGFLKRLERVHEKWRAEGETEIAQFLERNRGNIILAAVEDINFGPADDEAFAAWLYGPMKDAVQKRLAASNSNS